jgi:hypothetical protein
MTIASLMVSSWRRGEGKDMGSEWRSKRDEGNWGGRGEGAGGNVGIANACCLRWSFAAIAAASQSLLKDAAHQNFKSLFKMRNFE